MEDRPVEELEKNLEKEAAKKQEIILDLNKHNFNYSQIKKGMIIRIDQGIVDAKIFYDGKEQRENIRLKEFYARVGRLDLFILEEKNAEEYLIEKAERFGLVKTNKHDLLTIEKADSLDNRVFKYADKTTGEMEKLNCEQFSANLVLEGNLKEGSLLVVRQGKLVLDGEITPYDYLAVFEEKREPYLMDNETSNYKRWKNFCEKGINLLE